MTNETTNGVPAEYSVTFTQTAKGVFTIDKLVISSNTEKDLLIKAKGLLEGFKIMLGVMNNGTNTN